MKTVQISGTKRDLTTKGGLRSLRLKGQVPAVIYGTKKSSYPLSVNGKEFITLLRANGMNMLVNLKVGSETETVLVKEAQRDIISHEVIHLDFQRISLTEKLELNVPLHVKGEAPGVKLSGGILEHMLRDLRVSCLPADIPESITVDVSGLQINQNLKVKDLTLPKGIDVITDSEHLVVTIAAPSELEEVAAPGTAPAAGAEPEVIAKGKKPEEGAAAAPAAGAKGAAPAAGAKGAAPAAGAKGAPAGKEAKK